MIPWRSKELDTGAWGEKLAETALRKAGYRVVGRRVKVGKHDEIDLIARNGKVLVFIEVKTRKGESHGRPIAAVDKRKRRALCRAAVCYMKKIGFRADYFRFDVVEVIGEKGGPDPVLRHIENAFNLEDWYSVQY